MSNLIVQYKFDKSIYDNLIPEFNTEFTNYEIVDEYLDTEDIIITSTETMMLMNYDAKPDEYGVLTTEYEVENINTFSAENIVTRSIYNIKQFEHCSFSGCTGLLTVEFLNVTSSVFGLVGLFKDCTTLTDIKGAEKWNMINIDSYYEMFRGCSALRTINVSTWDTTKVYSMMRTFYGCNSLQELDLTNWKTNNVNSMQDMFRNCNSLTTVGDLSSWDTSKVTDMRHMFYNCKSLISLDLSNFKTNGLTDMTYMFRDCNSLTTVGDLSSWDVSNVTDMNNMFRNCKSLVELNVDTWNVSKVTTMAYMFAFCESLEKLEVSDWKTSSLTDISHLFRSCLSLTSININNWDVSKVTTIVSLFRDCSLLKSVYLNNWNPINVTDIQDLFTNCTSIIDIDLSNWNFNLNILTTMHNLFYNCTSLYTIKLNNWVIGSSINIVNLFYNCNNLLYVTMNNSDYISVNKIIAELPTKTTDSSGHLYIEGVDDHKLVNKSEARLKYWVIMTIFPNIKYYTLANEAERTFAYPIINSDKSALSNSSISIISIENEGSDETVFCIEIETQEDINSIQFVNPEYLLKMLILDTSNMTTMKDLFKNCTQLNSIECSDWDTSNVTDMSYMFSNCQSLTSLDVSNFNTSKVTTMQYIFYDCQSLTTLDVSKWNTSNVDCFDSMFFECNDLSELDLSSWDTSNVTDMGWMFHRCTSLNKLNISNWNTNSVTYIDSIFEEAAINEVIMNNSDYNSVNKIISKLPTRTTLGYMYVSRDILNDTNVSEAESKMWRILPLGGRVKNVYINGNNVSNMITKQNKKIKGIYLGNTPLL